MPFIGVMDTTPCASASESTDTLYLRGRRELLRRGKGRVVVRPTQVGRR
jgi:hypothetical protein